MRKIAIVVLAITMLLLCVVAPVMAELEGQKVPVTFTVKPLTAQVPVHGDSWYTPGGVFHVMGQVQTVSVVIKIGATSYNAFFVMTMDGMWNPQEKTMSMSTDDILYIPSDSSPNGFAGNGHLKFYNWAWGTPPSWTGAMIFHLWHGFGSFEGQTMLLSYDGPKSIVTTGWCLKS